MNKKVKLFVVIATLSVLLYVIVNQFLLIQSTSLVMG